MNLLTVGIPVFNGENTIDNALDALLHEIKREKLSVQIFISDNCSTDKTQDICSRYAKNNPQIITYIRNKTNLGYDANVHQLVKSAKSKYIWFHSDNEILSNNFAITTVLDFLKIHELKFLFLNHHNSINLGKIPSQYNNGNDFFKNTKFKSGLITNCVVNKDIWLSLPMDDYIGSQWIHFAYQIEALAPSRNLNRDKPIAGFIDDFLFSAQPSEAKWGHNGSFLQTGLLLVKVFSRMVPLGYAKKIKINADKVIIEGYPANIILAREQGLVVDESLVQEMKLLLSKYPQYWLSYFPALKIPLKIVYIYRKILFPLKFTIIQLKRIVIKSISFIKRIYRFIKNK